MARCCFVPPRDLPFVSIVRMALITLHSTPIINTFVQEAQSRRPDCPSAFLPSISAYRRPLSDSPSLSILGVFRAYIHTYIYIYIYIYICIYLIDIYIYICTSKHVNSAHVCTRVITRHVSKYRVADRRARPTHRSRSIRDPRKRSSDINQRALSRT